MMKDDKLIRNLFLGFIQVHILHHTGKEEVYGTEFKDELARHGYDISFGTLYPIFHRLEREGYISSDKRKINGKIRKYYMITKKGRFVLREARQKAEELIQEISE